jgi:hypothetical protein
LFHNANNLGKKSHHFGDGAFVSICSTPCRNPYVHINIELIDVPQEHVNYLAKLSLLYCIPE